MQMLFSLEFQLPSKLHKNLKKTESTVLLALLYGWTPDLSI